MPAGPVLRTYKQYSIAVCVRPEVASGIMSGRLVGLTIPDKSEKFRDHCLNRYGEIRPNAVGGGFFSRFRTSINAAQKQLVPV